MMKKREWTPGPWEAALERGCHGVIAQTLPEGGANFVAIVGNDASEPNKEPTRFANANLIAAAPDLYEALEEVLDGLGFLSGGDHELEGLGISEERVAEIRAALAKARGEE